MRYRFDKEGVDASMYLASVPCIEIKYLQDYLAVSNKFKEKAIRNPSMEPIIFVPHNFKIPPIIHENRALEDVYFWGYYFYIHSSHP